MKIVDIAGCAMLHVASHCYGMDAHRTIVPGQFAVELTAALAKCRLLLCSTNEYQKDLGIEAAIRAAGGYVIENLEHSSNRPGKSRGINIWAIPGAHPIYLQNEGILKGVVARGDGAIDGGKMPLSKKKAKKRINWKKKYIKLSQNPNYRRGKR